MESNSPWMAPAVFVRKKSGEIRSCVDYRVLNTRIFWDAYPLLLSDEVQDRLAGSTIFSTWICDVGIGNFQSPLRPGEETSFCPGPGMGLYEFCYMPFGL